MIIRCQFDRDAAGCTSALVAPSPGLAWTAESTAGGLGPSMVNGRDCMDEPVPREASTPAISAVVPVVAVAAVGDPSSIVTSCIAFVTVEETGATSKVSAGTLGCLNALSKIWSMVSAATSVAQVGPFRDDGDADDSEVYGIGFGRNV